MDKQSIANCLDQIRWKRFRDGAYSSRDPYLAVQGTLRKMRTDSTVELGKVELLMLLQATQESINHIQRREHLPETLTEVRALRDVLQQMVAEVIANAGPR